VPELPDVEGFRKFFDRHAAGKTVRALRGDASVIRNTTLQALERVLRGHRLGSAHRHGKWLICPAGEPSLVLHFGMGGLLAWDEEEHRHDRLTLDLGVGTLAYRDMRKLGGVCLAGDEAARTDSFPGSRRGSPEIASGASARAAAPSSAAARSAAARRSSARASSARR
jgi:formamidopyrimidine-DNA glycosylase